MIKFGIPSLNVNEDKFPGVAVLTINAVEKANAKKKFTLSKTAAEKLGVIPGISEVGFSFDGGRYIAVIPPETVGVAQGDRLPVSKELSFMSKKAHEFLCSYLKVSDTADVNLEITNFESIETGDGSYLIVGEFSNTPIATINIVEETPVTANVELI